GTIPYPTQNDPSVQTCFYGFDEFPTTVGTNIVTTWVDGRIALGGTQQEDIFGDIPVPAESLGTKPPPSPPSGDRVPPRIKALFKRRQNLSTWLEGKARLKFSLSEAAVIALRAVQAGNGAASADLELAMVPARAARAALIAKGSAGASRPGKVDVAVRLTKQG